jgi:hypothetical protein
MPDFDREATGPGDPASPGVPAEFCRDKRGAIFSIKYN